MPISIRIIATSPAAIAVVMSTLLSQAGKTEAANTMLFFAFLAMIVPFLLSR